MKHSKPMILLLTVLLTAIAVVFGRNEIGMRNFPFSVVVTSDGIREELKCQKLKGEYYMFLPSYARDENAQIQPNPVYDVFIDGQELEMNQPCADFPTNTKLELYFRSLKNEGYETVTFIKSEDMPTMYIDVPSGNMEFIHTEKGNSEPGWMRLYSEDGTQYYSGTLESLKGRGNNTWTGDKKPYSLELSQEADLLGMGQASRWILLTNANDASHLRNKISYDMAKALNTPYAPDCTWVHLYLNGEYTGLYLLAERNEVHPQRVSIDAAGSFLVAIEPDWRLREQGYPYVQTSSGMALRIHHNTMPQNTVQQIWQSAENAIYAEDGVDPVSGKSWDELIHMDSWARKYLMQEIFGNADVLLASEFFFYNQTDGLIYAGPIWDMDATLIDTDEPWLSDSAIIAGRPHLSSDNDKNLFYELLRKQSFYNRVKELYQEEFRPYLCQLLDCDLDRYIHATERAVLSHEVRWPGENSRQNTANMRTFFEKRIKFLDDYWILEKQFYLVQVQQEHRIWAFTVSPGETLELLPDMECGSWYRTDTDEILDETLPVERDLMIAVKNSDAF